MHAGAYGIRCCLVAPAQTWSEPTEHQNKWLVAAKTGEA